MTSVDAESVTSKLRISYSVKYPNTTGLNDVLMHVHDDGDTQFRSNVFVICTRFCSMLYDRQLLLRHNDQHLWNKADDAISCGIRKWLAHQLLGNEPSA